MAESVNCFSSGASFLDERGLIFIEYQPTAKPYADVAIV
jgi:hypothetical protein